MLQKCFISEGRCKMMKNKWIALMMALLLLAAVPGARASTVIQRPDQYFTIMVYRSAAVERMPGTEITSFDVLSQQLTKYKVGDTVKITVRRPTIELTSNNLSEYLSTSETVELEITFVEFNPNA